MIARHRILELYEAGVAAVESTTAGFTTADWAAPVCGTWTATNTAAHLHAVAQWYHGWLDRALDGERSRPFPFDQLASRNAHELEDLRHMSGPEAVAAFTQGARDYATRAEPEWDRPYAYPRGLVTVGLHLAVAAAEWHLHAWDLSWRGPERHEPADAEGLYLAVGECLTATDGPVRRRVASMLVRRLARRNPWDQLLERSGRDVDWVTTP